MKLLISASTIERAEKMLNEYFYSTTYKIVDNKVMFKNPLIENTNLTFKMKGKKYQIYTN
jgi:hypothetical protein